MKKNIQIVLTILFFLSICSYNLNAEEYPQVEKITCSDFAVWVVKHNNFPVYYVDWSCGVYTKNVLQNVSDDAVAGEFNWSDMQDPLFRERILYKECNRLKKEEVFRKTGKDEKYEFSKSN